MSHDSIAPVAQPKPSRATPHGTAAALKAEAPHVDFGTFGGDLAAGARGGKREARRVRNARKRRRGYA